MRPGKLLHSVGIVLYGPLWLPSLAGQLGVSPKTVQRWTQGRLNIPPGVWADLLKLDDPRLDRVRWRIERCMSDSAQSGSSRRPQ